MDKDLHIYKIAYEYAPIHIIFTDPDARILYANKAVEEITGYKRSEVIGNNPRLWGKQMPKTFYKKLWKTIKYEKKLFEGEITNKRKNGQIYIADARIAPVIDNKELIGFVGIERDITKEKQIDHAKTEFVSFTSHQLKNPLTIVSLFTDVLLKEKNGTLNKKQKKYLHQIKSANKRMIDLIEALLNVAKIELGRFVDEPKKTEVVRISKNVLKEFWPKIEEKKIKFIEKYPEKSTTVLIDQRALIIILQNLISNAVKYTPMMGKIILEVLAEKRSLSIKVLDTGIGIPKKEQNKIFTKMFRASNAQKDQESTGLGLYMVKTLIDQMKGKIWFVSETGKGTTFFVNLPV